MTPQEFAALLDRSLEDQRLSRGERQAIGEIAADEKDLGQFRKLAFERAAAALNDPAAGPILEWLEGVLKALQPRIAVAAPSIVEAHFSPGDNCCQRLISFLNAARRTLDLCVFTITDDRISSAIITAHRRGVVVRILTDDDKSHDLGSDTDALRSEGIAVRMDDTPAHMHHKFAIADGAVLLTGSFNWTRSASTSNQENFIITNDAQLVSAFAKEFEKLWSRFART
jgi:phosphatidylserine/phosphatidylglycerophosphate/cardiolipin synthase-like enzyme